MKERPKDFNTREIRAILEDRKTQFRWVIKPPFEIHPNGFITRPKGTDRFHPYKFPYGIGDIIWAREAWDFRPMARRSAIIGYKADGCTRGVTVPDNWSGVVYDDRTRTRPSITMPRWASRITLEITNIRVEWSSNPPVGISEFQLIKEGSK